MKVFIVMLALISLTLAINRESGSVCEEIRELFSRQCSANIVAEHIQGPPGKRGPIGRQGVKGDTGAPGPIAEIDYERIAANLGAKLERINEKLHNMDNKFNALEEKLNNVTEKQEKFLSPNCELSWHGKCFVAILHNSQDVNYNEGKQLCENIGAKLANIYSRYHYDVIERYLQTKTSPTGYVTAWIGLTWNQSANEVRLSSGQRISGLPWLNSYPTGSYSEMNAYASTTSGTTGNGIMNYYQKNGRRGALCES